MKNIKWTNNIGVFEKYKFSVSQNQKSKKWAAFVEVFAEHKFETIGTGLISKEAACGACAEWLGKETNNNEKVETR